MVGLVMVVNRRYVVKVVRFAHKVSMVVFLSERKHSTGSIRLLEFVVDGDQGLQCLCRQSTVKLLLLSA